LGKVSIIKITGKLKQSLSRLIDLLGGLNHFIAHDDKVLLKPNLNDFESYTSIDLSAALIELLLDFKVQNIFIAESTYGNEHITHQHFIKTGYVELAKKYNIKLVNLNKSQVIMLKVEKPLLLPELQIAREVFWASKIVNLPVMKVHYATGVTLALKNLKGFLAKDEKKHFHETGLDKAIVDLNNSIKPALNIIDCISCMEGMGPKGGEIFNLNLLIAGKNSGEVDYIGSKIMGYNVEDIAHLQYFLKANNIDINDIQVLGEKLARVIRPFKKVSMERIVPPSVVIHDQGACSSCVNALLLSFRFLKNEIVHPIDIFLGTAKPESQGLNPMVGFGNCCLKNWSFDKKVKGCPPYPFELKNILE
jgi:uncharacterized protein (DUF362 family)